MDQPRVDRPFMPDYGIAGPDAGTGLLPARERMIELLNPKYSTSYDVGFLDPDVNATVAVRPRRGFGLIQDDFSGSPTRWRFG